MTVLPKWPLFYTKKTVISYNNGRYFSFFEQRLFWVYGYFGTNMTVNSKKHEQIDHYWCPKWPLCLERKLTVILVKKVVQNGRYLYQNDHFLYKRNWRSWWSLVTSLCWWLNVDDNFRMLVTKKDNGDMPIRHQHNYMPECDFGDIKGIWVTLNASSFRFWHKWLHPHPNFTLALMSS